METNRHSIKAHRGETFTIDKVLKNSDGSPYIISNELRNPYLLISVTDTQYGQANRFYRNYWLSLEDYPRFTLTNPLDASEIQGWTSSAKFPSTQRVVLELYNTFMSCLHGGSMDSSNGLGGIWLWNSKLNISDFVMLNDIVYNFIFVSNDIKFSGIRITIIDNVLKLYYDNTLVMTLQSGIAVWENERYKKLKVCIISDTLMVTVNGNLYNIGPEYAVIKDGDDYIYWDGEWKPYECRIIKTFFSHDTKDWPAQNYNYSMLLAYGIDNREHLEELADLYKLDYSKTVVEYTLNAPPYKNNKELYDELVAKGYEFPETYDPSIPLWNVNTISLLSKSEILISNYAQGGVY